MKSISALLNIFIAVFALSLPGTSIVSQFTNIILAAYAGIFTVAFVYDNLPTNEYEQLSFLKAKLTIAVTIITGSPVLLYAYLWVILAPVGFNQILVLLVLVAIFYIPLAVIAWWIAVWIIVGILGID